MLEGMGETSTAGEVADSGERAQFAWTDEVGPHMSARVNASERFERDGVEWVRFTLNNHTTLELRADHPVEVVS